MAGPRGPVYPFTAIVGQERMRLALELNVLDLARGHLEKLLPWQQMQKEMARPAAKAVWRPMPRVAPVPRTTWPVRSISSGMDEAHTGTSEG